MEAVIFIKTSNKTLKPQFRNEYPDGVIFYRSDSFWSRSLSLFGAKKYSYKIDNGEVIINRCDREEFKKVFVDEYVSTLNKSFSDDGRVDRELYDSHIGESVIGYRVMGSVNHIDVYHIICHPDGNIDVIDSIIYNREKNINNVLK